MKRGKRKKSYMQPKHYKAYRLRVKIKVMTHYSNGTPRCRECGCDDINKLEINHIKGKGSEHRVELFGINSGSTKFYRWLMKNNFPQGYDVLCKLDNLRYKPETEKATEVNMEDF